MLQDNKKNLTDAITKLTEANLKLATPSMDGKNFLDAKICIEEAQKLLIEIQNKFESICPNCNSIMLQRNNGYTFEYTCRHCGLQL